MSGITTRFVPFGLGYQGGNFNGFQAYVVINNANEIYLGNLSSIGTTGVTDITSNSNIWVYYR
jgi:hypothetical protein